MALLFANDLSNQTLHMIECIELNISHQEWRGSSNEGEPCARHKGHGDQHSEDKHSQVQLDENEDDENNNDDDNDDDNI